MSILNIHLIFVLNQNMFIASNNGFISYVWNFVSSNNGPVHSTLVALGFLYFPDIIIQGVPHPATASILD